MTKLEQDIDDVSTLLIAVNPITADKTINYVAQCFLLPENRKLLCLPIVNNDGLLLGTLSRQRLQNIFMARFGRDLYGRYEVTKLMNDSPLMVETGQSAEKAAEYISSKIEAPITEDFVITDNGRYLGMGSVLDLLKAMELRSHVRNNELAEAYRHLKSSQAQLIQSEKMASLGQMVAGVAHEINTPLGYVRSNVELTQCIFVDVRNMLNSVEKFIGIIKLSSDKHQIQPHLIAIEQAHKNFYESSPLEDLNQLLVDTLYGIDQISEIVVNLKNFSRLDQAALASVDINRCLESSLIIAKSVLKHKCNVVKNFAELPTVACSPSQINQVFLNLLTNAAQAIEEHGTITITTWSGNGYVHISLADNGAGIAPANLAKIFDPFFTTKPIGQGTGLGLSIVYNIIEQHHGQIKVESEIGTGTKFTVSLPWSDNSKNASVERRDIHERKSDTTICGR